MARQFPEWVALSRNAGPKSKASGAGGNAHAKVTPSQNLAPARWNSPVLIGLVALGGAIGSLLRYWITLLSPTNRIFIATIVVNVIGSLVLGFLVGYLGSKSTESRRQQQIRLFVGTGICGGFTTYSTFALDIHNLVTWSIASPIQPEPMLAILYIFAMLIVGTLAAVIGMAMGGKWAT